LRAGGLAVETEMTLRLAPAFTDLRVVCPLTMKLTHTAVVAGGFVFFQAENGKAGEKSQHRSKGADSPAPEPGENTVEDENEYKQKADCHHGVIMVLPEG